MPCDRRALQLRAQTLDRSGDDFVVIVGEPSDFQRVSPALPLRQIMFASDYLRNQDEIGDRNDTAARVALNPAEGRELLAVEASETAFLGENTGDSLFCGLVGTHLAAR